MGLLLALLVVGLMWAMVIRPQQRARREHEAVIASLEPGDEVVTAGGVYGTIVSVDEDTLAVEVAPGVVLQILRYAVSQRVAPAEVTVGDDRAIEATTTDGGAADREDEV